jgi:hypothetical protein
MKRDLFGTSDRADLCSQTHGGVEISKIRSGLQNVVTRTLRFEVLTAVNI